MIRISRGELAAALLLCAGLAMRAGAQSVVHGRVVSKRDGAPIVAAVIAASDGRALARTNDEGRFTVSSARGDTVKVHALGYVDARVPLAGDTVVVSLEAFATSLAAVTTTAGQRTIRVNESTASVMVADRTDLEAAAAVSANQLLRQLPGLQEIPSPPSKSTISIRGLDAARVLVLVDGAPVPGSLIDTRDIGRLSTVATERVEVTKGPSSVEFGSDALGGVINLVTAAPSKTFAADALVRFGGLGRRESTLDISNTHGALGYRVSGGWRQMNRVFAVDAAETALERVYDVRTDVRYRANARLSLRGDVQLSQERQRWPVGAGYNGFIDNHGAQVLSEARMRTLAGFIRARAFAQFSDYQYRQSQKLVPIAGSADSLEQEERLVRGLVSYTRAAGAHIIDAGTELSARSIIAPGKIEGDRAHDRVFEVFARDAWSHGPLLTTVGARSTSSSLWGNAFAPSIGFAYQLDPTWRVRANVAHGFRAPSFKEIRYTFTNPIASYVIVGNPDLEPESSWNAEVGAVWAPGSTTVFEFAVFDNHVSNLIDTRLTGLNGDGFQIYKNINVAHARLSGAEFSTRFALRDAEVSVGYSYLRAHDADANRRLDRRAAHTLRTQVSQRWSVLKGATSDFTLRYTGAAPAGTVEQGAMFAVDGQLRANVAPRIELSAGINNAFDAQPALSTPAMRRQVFVGARVRGGALD